MREQILFIPGPTMMSQEVREALAKPAMGHRSAEFSEIIKKCYEGLKYLFATKNDVLILASSGSGAQASAVENAISPGEEIVILDHGTFSGRFGNIAKARGVAHVLKSAPGEAVEFERIGQILKTGKIKAIALAHNETSTSVMVDLSALVKYIRSIAPDVIVIVDAISTLGASPLDMDALDIDMLIGASQKVLAIPCGLSFIALSERALERIRQVKHKNYYLDLEVYREFYAHYNLPFSSPVNLIYALEVALENLKRLTLEESYRAHRENALFTQRSLEELGFELLVKDPLMRADTVSVFKTNKPREILQELHKKGLVIAPGQGELKDSVLRVGHLGHIRVEHLKILFDELGRLKDRRVF